MESELSVEEIRVCRAIVQSKRGMKRVCSSHISWGIGTGRGKMECVK